jgi:hypothetical protein
MCGVGHYKICALMLSPPTMTPTDAGAMIWELLRNGRA